MIDVTLDFSTEATHAESAGAPSSALSPSSIPSARRNLPPPIAEGSTGPQAASIADPDTPESCLEISHSQLGSIPGRDTHSRAGSTEAALLPRGRTSSRASEPPPRTSQRAKSRQPQATSNSSRPRSVAPKSGEKRKQPAGVVSDSEGHAPLAKRLRHGVYDRWQHDDLEAPEEIPKDYLLSV